MKTMIVLIFTLTLCPFSLMAPVIRVPGPTSAAFYIRPPPGPLNSYQAGSEFVNQGTVQYQTRFGFQN